jgi:shikimate kinase
MNIVLIGYRATGKSTVARRLAQKIGWNWVDLDVEIEHQAGKPIAQIFAEDGEPTFRDWESRVVAEFCQRSGWVIAAGGGAPLREDNRQAMRAGGKVVWLTASPETIHCRMNTDPTTGLRRPNLTSQGGLDEILQLLGKREPIYRQTADWIVDTEGKSPDAVVEEILDYIRPIMDQMGVHP